VACEGKPELWLDKLLDAMRTSLRAQLQESLTTAAEMPRDQWLLRYPTQMVLTAVLIQRTAAMEVALGRLATGVDSALPDFLSRLEEDTAPVLNMLRRSDVTVSDRIKLENVLLRDIAARDLAHRLIKAEAYSKDATAWRMSLRFYLAEDSKTCYADVGSARLPYGYEYVGNERRAVVTPAMEHQWTDILQGINSYAGAVVRGPAASGRATACRELAMSLGLSVCYPLYSRVFLSADRFSRWT